MPKQNKKRSFSTHLFFLIFWLTVIATILLSWDMIVVSPADSVKPESGAFLLNSALYES